MKEQGHYSNKNLDELLRSAFQKETDGIEAPDELKEKIDDEIGKNPNEGI
jgi:hypothetical protein